MSTRLIVIRGDAADTRIGAIEDFARHAERYAADHGWTILQANIADVTTTEKISNFRVTSTFIAGGTVLYQMP